MSTVRWWVWEYGLFEHNPKKSPDSLNPERTLEVVEADAYEALDAMYRQQLDDRDKTIHNLRESAKIWGERHATVQGERDRLFQVIELYRSASYQSHSAHFDPTGGSGSGCPACLRAIELRADARAILDSLAQPAAPSEVKE